MLSYAFLTVGCMSLSHPHRCKADFQSCQAYCLAHRACPSIRNSAPAYRTVIVKGDRLVILVLLLNRARLKEHWIWDLGKGKD